MIQRCIHVEKCIGIKKTFGNEIFSEAFLPAVDFNHSVFKSSGTLCQSNAISIVAKLQVLHVLIQSINTRLQVVVKEIGKNKQNILEIPYPQSIHSIILQSGHYEYILEV